MDNRQDIMLWHNSTSTSILWAIGYIGHHWYPTSTSWRPSSSCAHPQCLLAQHKQMQSPLNVTLEITRSARNCHIRLGLPPIHQSRRLQRQEANVRLQPQHRHWLSSTNLGLFMNWTEMTSAPQNVLYLEAVAPTPFILHRRMCRSLDTSEVRRRFRTAHRHIPRCQ